MPGSPRADGAAVYKHILLPTDGSALAAKGAKAGVKLAEALGAKVTAVYVAMPYTPAVYGDAAVYYAGPSPKEHKQFSQEAAKKALGPLESEARKAGVACAAVVLFERKPWEGILKAARSRRCDAIAMASHGRGGLRGAFLGSETQRVLAHSRIPVLVIR
jgi:nucleotide-binding universal stress UspA family protein